MSENTIELFGETLQVEQVRADLVYVGTGAVMQVEVIAEQPAAEDGTIPLLSVYTSVSYFEDSSVDFSDMLNQAVVPAHNWIDEHRP